MNIDVETRPKTRRDQTDQSGRNEPEKRLRFGRWPDERDVPVVVRSLRGKTAMDGTIPALSAMRNGESRWQKIFYECDLGFVV